MLEVCLRCKKTIKYEITDEGPACPECGWTKSAAQRYSNDQNKFFVKYAIGLRTKALGKSIFTAFLSCLFGLILYSQIGDAIELHSYGNQAIATVVDYKFETEYRRRKLRTYHYHTLQYEGNSKRVDLGQQFPIGTEFSILYLLDHPNTIMFGDADTSLYELVTQDTGLLGLILLCGAFGLFTFGAIWHIITLLRGVDPEEDE